jgi:hypothetical protein
MELYLYSPRAFRACTKTVLLFPVLKYTPKSVSRPFEKCNLKGAKDLRKIVFFKHNIPVCVLKHQYNLRSLSNTNTVF